MTTKTQGLDELNYLITVPDNSVGQTSTPTFIPIPDNSSPQPLSLPPVQPLAIPFNVSELQALGTFIEVIKNSPHIAEAPELTSGSLSTQDEVSNISYFVRTLMPEAAATQAIGITTGENASQGFWAAVKAAARYVQAQSIGDRGGMIEGGSDYVRGVTQSVGGLAYIGYRGVMIPADIQKTDTSIKAVTPLGQSAYILGMIGNIGFLLFYLMIGIWSGNGLYEDFKFSARMKAFENDPAQQFNFLMQKVTTDPKRKLEKFKAYFSTLSDPDKKNAKIAAFKDKLADAALSKFVSHFLKWQDELIKEGNLKDKKPLTEQQVKETFKKLFEFQEEELSKTGVRAACLEALGLDDADLQGLDLSTLELVGFIFEQVRSQAKKEAKFSRATGDDCTEAVKKAAKRGLSERLKCDDDVVKQAAETEMNELKGRVVSANTKNKWIHSILMVVAITGVVSSILGMIILSPILTIVMTAVSLVLVTGMLITDGSSMVDGWKTGNAPGSHDKTYIIVTSIVLIAAIAVSIGLTLGLGLPLLPMILACAIGGLSLGLNGFAYYKLTQKEKAWIENHPDLQRFQELLDSSVDVDEKVTELFKKLPKEDRLAIRRKYGKLSAGNEFKFKQERYRTLDANGDFGHFYLLNEINTKSLSDEREHQLLLRAMKKTVKFYWERWAQTKDKIDRERALKRTLKIQSVFDRVKQKQLQDLESKFTELMRDGDLYDKLKNDVWYVVKRQESLADLKHAVAEVQQDKNRPQIPVGPVKDKITPLFQRVITDAIPQESLVV